jgi:hypothetical protein
VTTYSDFEKGLNQHGYAFHQRLLDEVVSLAGNSPASKWRVLTVELPVIAGEANTRIDFVLEAAECKRVNPKYGSWCFAKARHISPRWAANQLIPESIVNLQTSPVAAGTGGTSSPNIYQIAFAIDTGKSGDRPQCPKIKTPSRPPAHR